jgi:hypothetical protein
MLTQYKRTNWVQRREDFSSSCSSGFRLGRLLLAWLLAGFISSLAYAVPITTNYQGYLESADAPLNETVDMTFALYDEGGVNLWTETHPSVVVTDGVFSLVLGSISSFENVDLDGKCYLGISVGGDAEMSPRQELTSGFSALRAGVADSVGAAAVDSEAIADGAVTAEKIAPQTITGDKIANLSGHNVIELDDVADAGSGKIISDAERQKLEDLGTGGVGSNPTFNTVVVEDQLNVKKQIKVGEHSLVLGGAENHIWTTPDGSGDKKIYIQSIPHSGDTILNAVNGKVGIGTTTDPKNKLDVVGSVAIGYAYAGKEAALPNGLIVEDTVSIGYGESDLESDDSYVPGEKHKSPPSGLVVKGKVGIGTSKPQHELHLDIENAKIAFGDNNTFERANKYGAANVLVGEYDDEGVDSDKLQLHGKKGIYFTTGNYGQGIYRLAMRIDRYGHVGVNGKLSAKEIEVKLEDWSDYVFDEDYELMPLNEVESYINANKHLPDIPSVDEITENGLNLGETDALLLRKIEELTLYVIEQNKRIEKLEMENEDLKQMLSK